MELGEKYIFDVYQEKGFKKAAEKNFISQAALSATVKKTERKLGFLVFDRSQSPVALTPEGKIYIQYLEDAAENERILQRRISSLSNSVLNRLSVGGTSFFARKLFPQVADAFFKKHPDTELRVDLGEMHFYSHLIDKLDTGNADLIIGYRYDSEKHDVIPILEERYIIAAKKDLPGIKPLLDFSITKEELFSKKEFPDKEISDPSFFKGVNFIDMGTNSVLRSALKNFIEELSFYSWRFQGTRKNDIYYELMLKGLGAVITTDFTASCYENSDDVVFFLLDIKNKRRKACIIHKKDAPLSVYAEDFINLCREVVDSGIILTK